jgi:hypothetical protein
VEKYNKYFLTKIKFQIKLLWVLIAGDGYGRIFIGDVGDSTWEEIDILEYGGNYGWSAYEGPNCFKPELCDNIGKEVISVTTYD